MNERDMQYLIYQNSVGAWRALFTHGAITKAIAVAPIAYPTEEACRRMIGLVRDSLNAPVVVAAAEPGRCEVHIDPDRS
jgi:hypothetical protein